MARPSRTRQPRPRRIPRAAIVLAVALAAFAIVLATHHGSGKRETPPALSDRPRLLRAAATALRSDPSVADVVYTPGRDEWNVTPARHAIDPRAFARYVCFVIESHGVMRLRTIVRVIDDAALEANGFDYDAASRGALTCDERT